MNFKTVFKYILPYVVWLFSIACCVSLIQSSPSTEKHAIAKEAKELLENTKKLKKELKKERKEVDSYIARLLGILSSLFSRKP